MMQHILNVLQPATSVSLLSLDEAKMALNVSPSNTTYDDTLVMFIEQMSDSLAKMARRSFVYEQVQETFFDINDGSQRIFFSKWPVKLADIVRLTVAGVDIMPNLWPPPVTPPAVPVTPPDAATGSWVLEEKTGTLYTPPQGFWQGNVDAVYAGGYILPLDAPPSLKALAITLTRDAYYAMLRGMLMTGVRMIAHKQARVMYYPTGAFGAFGATGRMPAATPQERAVNDVISAFIRHWL